jgi:hypothetical protein
LTDAIRASSIIKAAKKQADKLTNTTDKTVLPTITSQTEVQDKANQLNVINQLVIGVKESVVKATVKLVGSNITNAILQMADGSNHKSIDNFVLFDVLQVAIDRADSPSMNDVLEQLIEVTNHTFNFCKKVSINMELMQLDVA